ncbi:MAG: IPT/TIG domain-containing protein [Candidatus Nanopelagicales bacterium]
MNAVDNSKVLVGAPDQLVTGAILSAPRGTPLPTHPRATLNAAFKSSGYVGEEGVSMSLERSLADIKDWSGAVIRKILEEFAGQLSWAHLETNIESAKNFAGDDQVSISPATAEHGELMTMKLGAFELPRKSWVIKLKDGDARAMIVIEDGQITETDDITFSTSEPVTWPVTLSAYPASDGSNIKIVTDDGVFSGTVKPVISGIEDSGEGEGDIVKITGTGFVGATDVTFDGISATDIEIASNTVIYATLPADGAGEVDVVVESPAGDSDPFSYTRGA